MMGKLGWVFAVACLLASCAQQVTPKGGPKDQIPPTIVASTPENYSTNFTGNTIELEFDEFVQLRNINQAMVISPPLSKQPDTKLRGKRLTITFEDTLSANTTYIFNLGDGVQDITENNPLDSNLFVFSTGDFLDSLTVKGRIKQAIDLKPAETAWVMLYETMEDSAPRTLRPAYLGKADKSGNFTIDFVKPGQFKVAALTDINNNYLFDAPEEQIAFLDTPVVSDSLPFVDLYLFTEEPTEHYVSKLQAQSFGQLLAVFNKPTENPTVRDLSGAMSGDWYRPEHLAVGDSLLLWVTNNEGGDTLELELSTNGQPLDTAEVVLLKRGQKPPGGRRAAKPFALTFNSNAQTGKASPFKPLILNASHPLAGINPAEIVLEMDSVPQEFTVDYLDEIQHKIAFTIDWKHEKRYRLFIPPGAIEDVFGLKNDTIEVSFTVQKPDDFGNLNLNVQLTDEAPSYVVELLDEKGKLVQTDVLPGPQIIAYKNLQPGTYGVKLTFDANSNGKWDTGNYDAQRQPEKVLFYSGKMEIRAGWDIDLEWQLNPDTEGRAK